MLPEQDLMERKWVINKTVQEESVQMIPTHLLALLPLRGMRRIGNVISFVWWDGVIIVGQWQTKFHVFFTILVRSLLQAAVLVFFSLKLPSKFLLWSLLSKQVQTGINKLKKMSKCTWNKIWLISIKLTNHRAAREKQQNSTCSLRGT